MDNPYLPTMYNIEPHLLHDMAEPRTVAGWEGAFLMDGMGPPRGALRMEHQAVMVMRWHSALVVQPLDRATGWEVHEPQTRVWLPGEQFHYQWRTAARSQQLFISQAQVEAVLDLPFHRSGLAAWAGLDFADPVVNNLVESLSVDGAQAHPQGLLCGEIRLAQLVSHLCAAKASGPGRRQDTRLTGAGLRAVLDYMHAHLGDKLSLQVLSAQAGCTPQHFARLFCRATGTSAHQYLLNLRVERACQLLRGDVQSLSQVAVELGFADQSQFTKVFHKLCGTSPHRYRALMQRRHAVRSVGAIQ